MPQQLFLQGDLSFLYDGQLGHIQVLPWCLGTKVRQMRITLKVELASSGVSAGVHDLFVRGQKADKIRGGKNPID